MSQIVYIKINFHMKFPGMYRSCPLVQNFAKQGLKIRIRKESGPRPSRYTQSKRKSLIKPSDNTSEDEEEIDYTQHPSAFKRVMTSQGKYSILNFCLFVLLTYTQKRLLQQYQINAD